MVICQGDPVGYCGNPKRAIKELTRVAKKGAYVIVSVDGFYNMVGVMLAHKKYRELETLLRTHVSSFDGEFKQYNFTIDELKELFEGSGLKVIGVVGKPVFMKYLAYKSERERNKLLRDKLFLRRLIEIEKMFGNNPSISGLSGHIEMVGVKR
jgi:hypothetical protein